jgi:hypothetical protein
MKNEWVDGITRTIHVLPLRNNTDGPFALSANKPRRPFTPFCPRPSEVEIVRLSVPKTPSWLRQASLGKEDEKYDATLKPFVGTLWVANPIR